MPRKGVWIFIISVLFVFNFCHRRSTDSFQKKIIDGVEIIINEDSATGIEGYSHKIVTKQLFTLDTESREFNHLGLKGILYLDVDSKGNIYFSDGQKLWQFNPKVNSINQIGRAGQGPGEFKFVENLRVIGDEMLSLYDPIGQKFIIYYLDGRFKEELKLVNVFTYKGVLLDNGNFLILKRKELRKSGKRMFSYVLMDDNFNLLQRLAPQYSIDLLRRSLRFNLMDYSICLEIAGGFICIASNMSKQLEIFVYDMRGNLEKIIRKKEKRKILEEKYKKKLLEKWQRTSLWETIKVKYYFPRYFPPFKRFCVDEKHGIFVEKYDYQEESGLNAVDWFDISGIFRGRLFLREATLRKIKGNYMYCVDQKKNGFPRITVYEIKFSI